MVFFSIFINTYSTSKFHKCAEKINTHTVFSRWYLLRISFIETNIQNQFLILECIIYIFITSSVSVVMSKNDAKKLTYANSFVSTRQDLPINTNRVYLLFKTFCIILRWTKIVPEWKGLISYVFRSHSSSSLSEASIFWVLLGLSGQWIC